MKSLPNLCVLKHKEELWLRICSALQPTCFHANLEYSSVFASTCSVALLRKPNRELIMVVFCAEDTCPLGNALRPSTQFTAAREQLPDGNYFWSLPTWLNLNWWPRGEMLYILLLIPWGFQFLIHHFFQMTAQFMSEISKQLLFHICSMCCRIWEEPLQGCCTHTVSLKRLVEKRMFPKLHGSFPSSLAMYFVSVIDVVFVNYCFTKGF